jgi:hypothetical protein
MTIFKICAVPSKNSVIKNQQKDVKGLGVIFEKEKFTKYFNKIQ